MQRAHIEASQPTWYTIHHYQDVRQIQRRHHVCTHIQTSVKPAGADEGSPRGAGLSGLTLALALRKLAPEVEFEIYEGATQLSEVGAGLSLQERPWSIMQALGLDTVLKPIAGGGENQSTITNASGARPKVADRLP